MKKTYLTAALAAAVTLGAVAQQNTTQQQANQQLNKEITLEKDFVPVEKKATKKNTLPKAKKVATPPKTEVTYSDWASPTDVPASIPTMMPYGYHTAHNFSHSRGYLYVGGGTAANFTGSAGYRIIDTETTALGAWVQHNSTWSGKNSSPLITGDLLKQQYNDNLVGVDLTHRFNAGTISAGLNGHFDSFNYYGSNSQALEDVYKRQTFIQVGANVGWDGTTALQGHEVTYGAKASFSHAHYDKGRIAQVLWLPLGLPTAGAAENMFNLTLNGEFNIAGGSYAGLEVAGDFIRFKDGFKETTSYGMVTISPYYKWEGSNFRAKLGADILLGRPHLLEYDHHAELYRIDDNRFHISPQARIDFDFAPGAAVFIEAGGGKVLNDMASMAIENRYSDPAAAYYNAFSPFDGNIGFVIGPFAGFSAKLYGGYAFLKGDLNSIVPSFTLTDNPLATTHYVNLKLRGMRFGGELKYRYRSLIEARADVVCYPSSGDDDPTLSDWNVGISPNYDNSGLVANAEVKVNPFRKFSFEVGLHIRADRSMLVQDAAVMTYEDGSLAFEPQFDYIDMNNVFNLHAGATYSVNKTLKFWAKAHNLLNRKSDFFPGMSVQKIGVMAGVGLVF